MNLAQDLILVLAVLAAAWLIFILLVWIQRPSRALVMPALRLIPDVGRLARALLGDPETPLRVKLAVGGLLVYLVSPIDLIPDFIPGLGSVDDLVIAAVVLRWACRQVGVDGLRRQWTGPDASFELLRRLLGI